MKLLFLLLFFIPLTFIYYQWSAVSPTPSSPSQITPPPQFAYPIIDYHNRLKNRRFGQLISAADNKNIACGAVFQGYHTGDDLEVFSTESSQAIDIRSIASGSVKYLAWVNGYGGLLVLEHQFQGQPITAYYGHLSLASISLKIGDTVAPNQIIGQLGQACSQQTDGERRHLHFAIHKGAEIDLRGYVSPQSELANWINPELLLTQKL